MFPMEQVGKILYNNQITEELPHSADAEVVKKSHGGSEFLFATADASLCYESITICMTLSDGKIRFPHNHSKDIHNPPPNFRYLI